MEPWDFFKPSALYLLVHMELSLRLSVYFRYSLGGYIMDTAVGFPVQIMEALAS
jgi:hypothetical protein